MRERFDDLVRMIADASKDFAAAREDRVLHTGHIMYAVFATGASNDIHALAAVTDGAAKAADTLAGKLPEGLVRRRNDADLASDAFASTMEHAIMNARARHSGSISLSDLLLAILATEPNVATHVLSMLAVDRDILYRELAGPTGPAGREDL
jgi:ATP-dependent Clp protease ATP-binding subunit ClpA